MTLRKIFMFLAATAMIMSMAAGCAKNTPGPQWIPTCDDALSGKLSRISNDDLGDILDDAAKDRQKENCFIPLVKLCLDRNREISANVLARAVHELNSRENVKHFHKAVFRYYSSIIQGQGSYGSAEKDLLTEYCRYTIQNARSARDQNLRNAERLASNLDPDLFEKLFR